MSTSLAGRPLVEASWALLKRDPSMVVLLVVGGFASSVAFALVALPAYLVVGLPVDDRGSPAGLVVYALALFASTLVSTFFLGAVVDAAMQRADGGDPTFGSAMAAAWARRRELVAWAAMSAAVGVALRQLERFGVAGAVVRLLAGVSWAVATAFAIPVIMAEGTMPLDTVRRSAHILTSRFGTNARATLRFGVVVILVWLGLFALFMIGLYGVYDGSTRRSSASLVIGALLMIAAVLGGFIASAVVNALGAYLRTVLYRYATGLPTPGIDPWVLPPLLPDRPQGGGPGYAGAAGYADQGSSAEPPPAPSLFTWPGPQPVQPPIQPPQSWQPMQATQPTQAMQPPAYGDVAVPAPAQPPTAFVSPPPPVPAATAAEPRHESYAAPAPTVLPTTPAAASGGQPSAGSVSPYPVTGQVFLPEDPA